MAVLTLLYFGILLIMQGTLGIPWSAKPAARYAGYDLERGPVLYEAYYPEEQEVESQPANTYQEKRYFDRPIVPEISYQIPSDPYELPYRSEVAPNRDEYYQPNSAHFSAFSGTRPQTVQRNNDEQRVEEYFLGGQSVNGFPVRKNLEFPIVNDYSFRESQQTRNYINRDREASPIGEQNEMDIEDEVQRIVPIDDEFIFGERPVQKVPDFTESFRNPNENEVFNAQRVDSDLNGREQIQPLPMENIFEPRPQIINYVFSTPEKTNVFKPVLDITPEFEDNDWPRNYGDNLIQDEIKRADEKELKQQEAKIDSIEVSQVPHHKIRHHHGERPKRNYVHQ
ncbi:uncharacterized protein LOC107220117 [Neodiprion lecontei]|uniref:Uncharacterized protein LOC107220117 n=1 Tax=Neodiprion lecontei TaxID=441921 RepID=A0A6J0BGX7_NEOLC|nr:uncharacterized protein LOC107220117 [Neodiprion lecontei]